MSRRVMVAAALLAVVIVGYVLATRPRETCTACLTFNGRAGCATASGATADVALEAARRRACAEVAPADSVPRCVATPPASVQCRS